MTAWGGKFPPGAQEAMFKNAWIVERFREWVERAN